jgi:hypothetical protein
MAVEVVWRAAIQFQVTSELQRLFWDLVFGAAIVPERTLTETRREH